MATKIFDPIGPTIHGDPNDSTVLNCVLGQTFDYTPLSLSLTSLIEKLNVFKSMMAS